MLDCKDALTRMLLDFVDIFNNVEILSVNDCVGVGSFVSEESSLETAIQVFCTASFVIVWVTLEITVVRLILEAQPSITHGETLYPLITACSIHWQNLPFLVIRIVVWAHYKLYSLGFLVKNVTVIVLSIPILFKLKRLGDE